MCRNASLIDKILFALAMGRVLSWLKDFTIIFQKTVQPVFLIKERLVLSSLIPKLKVFKWYVLFARLAFN